MSTEPASAAELCYMCPEMAETAEHVPPRAFFPKEMRKNLWTVPSCEAHNLDNSADIEYVRNAISVQAGTNEAAEKAFEVAKRSWSYSPKLFNRTFREFHTRVVGGEEVGAFPFDLGRVTPVMVAIAHALAHRDFGRQYIGNWRVFCATLKSRAPSEQWDRFRAFLNGATFEPATVPEPEVFRYGLHRTEPHGFIYQLMFYGGFVVYAWPVIEQD